MSAKRLGRFTAGLFVALGLAFGGSLMASAGGDGAAPVVADAATFGVSASQLDFEWG
jgi:hypothetical protein